MKRDIWLSLFFLGLVLFCGPFLSIFRDHLAYYLFAAWFAYIVLTAFAARASKREDGGR